MWVSNMKRALDGSEGSSLLVVLRLLSEFQRFLRLGAPGAPGIFSRIDLLSEINLGQLLN
jgi:hypothetical protein